MASNSEICLIGNFSSEYTKGRVTGPSKKKVIAANTNRWQPDSDDFTNAAYQGGCSERSCNVIKDLNEIFASIYTACGKGMAEKGQIKRINLFSHSKVEMIGLCGKVIGATVDLGILNNDARTDVPARDEDPRLITPATPDLIAKTSFITLRKPGKPLENVGLQSIFERLASDAKFYIYSCEAGATKAGDAPNVAFLRPLADALHADVQAFTGFIKFTYRFKGRDEDPKPPYTLRCSVIDPNTPADEKGQLLEDDDPGVSDFHELESKYARFFSPFQRTNSAKKKQ
jgi:hypothetical protein